MTELTYTADLTLEDVAGLEAFANERLEAYRSQQSRLESETWRITFGLEQAVRLTAMEARITLKRRAQLAESTDPSDRRELIQVRYDVREAWNTLVAILSGWNEEPGYDRDRWRPTNHLDAEAEKRHDADVERLGLTVEQLGTAD
ncbi:hypothetical protein [Streptomyces sp. BH104]|uniref:hypothetical protein n=1 Tax=unclassified Streptomyces TaxID=2593676 RepID=UPI003BB6B37B